MIWARTYLGGIHSSVQMPLRGISTTYQHLTLRVTFGFCCLEGNFIAPCWSLWLCEKCQSKSTWSWNVGLWSQRLWSVVWWLHCSGTEAPQNIMAQDQRDGESRKHEGAWRKDPGTRSTLQGMAPVTQHTSSHKTPPPKSPFGYELIDGSIQSPWSPIAFWQYY